MHVTPVTSFDTIDNSVIIVVFTVDIDAFGGDLNRFVINSTFTVQNRHCSEINLRKIVLWVNEEASKYFKSISKKRFYGEKTDFVAGHFQNLSRIEIMKIYRIQVHNLK